MVSQPIRTKYENIFKEMKLDDESFILLNELFENQAYNDNVPISNRLYFNRYFSLSLQSTEYSTASFNEAFESDPETLKAKLIQFNTSNSQLFEAKLKTKFKDLAISDKDQFTKIISSLLNLYKVIFASPNLTPDDLGLSTTSLGMLIFQIVSKAKLTEKSLDAFKTVILATDDTFLDSNRNLVIAETANSFANSSSLPVIKNFIYEFRDLQTEFLNRIIVSAGDKFDARIINQMQVLQRFVVLQVSYEPNTNAGDWFPQNIIRLHLPYLHTHAKDVIENIKQLFPSNSPDPLGYSQQILKSIFGNYDSLPFEMLADTEFNELFDIYSGYQTWKSITYTFQEKVPIVPGRIDFNDDVYPESFEIGENLFQVIINPLNTPFWRLGFRLSRSNDFPAVEESRHILGYPFIVITKGDRSANENLWKDTSPPSLELTVYDESNVWEKPIIVNNYNNEKIEFRLKGTLKGQLEISIRRESSTEIHQTTLTKFSHYKFTRIQGWCDSLPFSLQTTIRAMKASQITKAKT